MHGDQRVSAYLYVVIIGENEKQACRTSLNFNFEIYRSPLNEILSSCVIKASTKTRQ